MKKIVFLILLGIMTTFAWAQTAQSSMIEFNKTRVPGVIIAITDYDASTVQDALRARMERIGGLRGSNSRGFRLYGGQVFADFGSIRYDIYTRVIPGNRRNKDVIVNLLVSTGNENFVSPTSDPELTQRMIDFLTDFANTFLRDFDRNNKINAKTKDLQKMERDYRRLVSNRDKTKRNLENQERAVAAKAEEIAKVRAALGILRQ